MLCEFLDTNFESLAKIYASLAEIQNFIYGIAFLLVHSV